MKMVFNAALKAFRVLVGCCLLSLFVGRSSLGAPTDYPHAYKALMEDCRTKTGKLSTGKPAKP